MCRLFGMLSVEASNARKHLVDAECSLFTQSKVDRQRLQSDGWGIGYYVNGSPLVVKSPNPLYMELDRFISAVEEATSKIIIAHVRRASNPKGLPRERLISLENTQPFTYGSYIFAHNGTITIPDEIKELLDEWQEKVRGVNDSEIYFWYIVKELEKAGKGDLPEVLQAFMETLWDSWERHGHKHPDKKQPYRGLNTLFSDGKKLYAYCKYEKEDETSLSLCLRDQPFFQMSYSINSTSLIVASEKTNRDANWKALGNGKLLTAEIHDKTIRYNIANVP